MRLLRVAAVLGVCTLACAKRGGDATAPPQNDAEAKAGKAEDTAKKLELEDAPTRDGGGEGDGAGMSPVQKSPPATLEELTAELDAYEAELRAEGVRLKTYRKDKDKQTTHAKRVPPTKPADAAGAKKDDPQARICAIKTSVCEIRSRICSLAAEHEDEPRYAAACKRATNDCKRASEACDES